MHAVIKQFYRRTHLKKPEICVEAVEMTACTSVIPAPADTVIVWISGTGKDVYLHGQARKVKTTMSQKLTQRETRFCKQVAQNVHELDRDRTRNKKEQQSESKRKEKEQQSVKTQRSVRVTHHSRK